INELSAGLALDVPREFEAEYPGTGDQTASESSAEDLTSGRITLPDFVNISSELIPDETLNYLNALRISVENENQDWTAQINLETDEIRRLGDRISLFLDKPLPAKSDIQGWTSLTEEGKDLSSEVVEKQNIVNRYQSSLDSAAHKAKMTLENGKAAVQSDMNKVTSNLDINDKMINQWLETIITSFAGPQTAEYYRKISKLILRFIDIKDRLSLSEKKNDGSRRMSHGRIVTFPVHLPPRFSIRTVRIDGEGISIDGSNIGIDHDLAGAPSIIMIQLNGFHGMEGLLSLDLTIDGRKTAEDSAFGSFNTSEWLWSAGDEIPGGLIAADSVFSINPGEIRSQGQIVLSDWIAVTESSGSADILSFISSTSPPLAFLFNLEVVKDETDMSISIDKESLPPWKKMFADSILSAGKDQAVKALPPAAVDDLMAIEAVLGDWENKEDLLDNLSDEL
ncbi:MAG: hypothetical protein KAH21_08525, partial [Spirochaetaceae bacterium]|nr:hypothetical protein [Spirochaetaceae bacterium]